MARVIHKSHQQTLPESKLLKGRGYTVDSEDAAESSVYAASRHSRSHSSTHYRTFREQEDFNDTYFAHIDDTPPMPPVNLSAYRMDQSTAIPLQTPPSSSKPEDTTVWLKDERPPAMPGFDDPKYASYTVSGRRDSGQRRTRGQRRRTDCSDEIQANIRRPSTSHSLSPSSRKVTYSQYPDFETIADPFAKRDKIPRKSVKPLFPDAASAQGSDRGSSPSPDDRSGTALSSQPQPPHMQLPHADQNMPAAEKNTVRDEKAKENSGPLSNTQLGLAQQRSNALAKHAQYPNTMSIALRKQHTAPAERIQEPAQMEPVESALSGPPASVASKQPNASRSARQDKPTATPPEALPLSPLSQNSQPPQSTRTMDSYSARNESLSPRSLDVNTAAGPPALIRPFSGQHLNSPRLDIDMDKVETLYVRSSLIFEKNKQKREARSRLDSAVAEADVAGPTNANRTGSSRGLGVMASEISSNYAAHPSSHTETRVKPGSNHGSNDDDGDRIASHKNDEDYIPFEQVLIPTVFKRLRAAVEDPKFEIDEETYRRFKLSERWYAREEHAQMEIAFTAGTFGESKDRGHAVRKDHSEPPTETAPQEDSAAADPDPRLRSQLASNEADEVAHDTIPLAPIASPPARKRTASRRRSQRSTAASTAHGSLRRYPIPAEDVPQMPDVVSPRSGRRHLGDSGAPGYREKHNTRDTQAMYIPPQLKSDMRHDSLRYTRSRHDAAALGGQHGPSASHVPRGASIRHHTQPGTRSERKASSQQQNNAQPLSEQKSSGCCGCTIM
ncbi:hypothetical protein IWW48_004405 [Coemansia sp. RSA 1200]|nr:hypothetical protein IWW48_004405 [Coemansia sp. RSA 1200]